MAASWKAWAGHGVVVAATVATGMLSVGLWDSARDDVGGYAGNAVAFWHGNPPFHAWPQEYPPFALLPLSLTLAPLPGAPISPFIVGFAVLFLAGYLCCLRFASRGAATRYALYLLLGAQGALLDRYDLMPALLSVAALWCAHQKRFAWAYLALAVGAALKLYPLVLLPVVAIAHYRSLRAAGGKPASAYARTAAGAATSALLAVALVFLPAVVTGQRQEWLQYAVNRPVQMESVPGTLVWLGTLLGVPAHVENSFGSQGWVGGPSGAVSGPSLAIGMAGFAWLWWRQARTGMPLDRAALASLCLLVVSSKVLSVQYLIWVLPVAAIVGGFTLWWIAVAALTSLDYPLLLPYSKSVPPLSDWPVRAFFLDVALRNALLVAITLRLLLSRAERGSSVLQDKEIEDTLPEVAVRPKVR
jgi:hypothetical protein